MTQQMFDITKRELVRSTQPSAVLAEVSGEIDVTSATGFAQAIHAITGPDPLIIDLTRLTYIDSAGFAALDRLLRQHTITMVVDPRSPIHAAAKLIDLPCHDTVADAEQAIRRARSWRV